MMRAAPSMVTIPSSSTPRFFMIVVKPSSATSSPEAAWKAAEVKKSRWRLYAFGSLDFVTGVRFIGPFEFSAAGLGLSVDGFFLAPRAADLF